jgi:hypothetical protein
MKKIILILILFPVLISCNQKKIQQLEGRHDSLLQQTYEKDLTINEFLTAFNEVQANLDSIKAKEMMITDMTAGSRELKKNVQSQINDDINSIYALLLDSRTKLEDVRKKLGRSDYQVTELEKMLARMTSQIEEKDQSIAELRSELEKMNIKITGLTEDVTRLEQEGEVKSAMIEDQSRTIEEKTIEINTAYFIVGNRKDLLEKNIITTEGGFIGIGKSKQLKPDFDEEQFTKIDIRNVSVINIPGRKVEIVTTHPNGSYTVEGDGDERVLNISNYEEFWKSSKYLVVVAQ